LTGPYPLRLRSFAFGPFALLPERQMLMLNGSPVRIGGRALDILTMLVEHAGEIVSKRMLMAQVWPNVVVDESNLKVNMAALRRALGDGASDAQYIATVTGRGYRFVAAVEAMGRDETAAMAPQAGAMKHNLPISITRVFGRADVITTLSRELEAARLVSIVGPGGIGKTTVALAIAERSLDRLKDGVWLIDLATLKDASLVPDAIAAAIGVGANSANMLTRLCEFLRGREMLLVLDSCEHLIDATASCARQILATASGVRILATSREPLMVSGERVRRLPGLTAPPPHSVPNADEALMYPAVQLFVERAGERLESFSLSDEDAPAVADICHRLDGMALAIELAAPRIEAFGVAGLLAQLDDQLVLPGWRAGPERHRTITATMDWSVRLLAEAEAAFLLALAVFSRRFDTVGAAAVAGVRREQAIESLSLLADKSLISTEIDNDQVVYHLLETTRSYCLDRLQRSGQLALIRQRHAEFICSELDRAATEWAQRPASEWGASYARVIDDLRSALDWTGQDEHNRELRIKLTLGGILVWNHFSLTDECHRHVSRTVEGLSAAGFQGTEFEMKLKLWLGGSTMFTEGLRPVAMQTLQRALEIAVQLANTDYQLRCLVMIGIYQLFTGEHEAGFRTMQQFNTLASVEDPSVIPEGEVHFGIAELFLGRLQDARHRLEALQRRDLTYFGSYGVRYLSDANVMVGCVLTQVQWLVGMPDTAMRTATDAVALAQKTRHHLSLNNILSYAVPVFYWRGDLDRCEQYVEMLEEHVLQHGITSRRPVAIFYRAALRMAREGVSASCVERLSQALEDFRRTNHLARMPYYLSVLADAQLRQGCISDAESTIAVALQSAEAQKEGWALPEVLRVQAAICIATQQRQTAEELLVKSMAFSQKTNALSWRLRAATDLARLWQGGPKEPDAHAMLKAVFNQFEEGFDTQDLCVAAELLDVLASSVTPSS
jgi:predicted ATPase/DNA-binding winged helix-turn-helix (wHTH) protein